ncbi:unnamed protein product [Closterium sp. NIES-53]
MALLGTPPQFLPPSLTRLPDRLMPVRNALLAMHPMCLITELIKFHLTKVETRFRTIASTTGVVVLPIFEGCSPPQFPTPTASAAVTQPTARAEIAAVFALYGGWGKHMGGRDRGKGGVLVCLGVHSAAAEAAVEAAAATAAAAAAPAPATTSEAPAMGLPMTMGTC